MNLFLIGYRCSGKTSVGRLVAQRLGCGFFDADLELTRVWGQSIAGIVAESGWKVFRRRERETIRALCQKDRCVIATGGGSVLDDRNVHRMRANGIVVWLLVGAPTVLRRMQQDALTGDQRPALSAKEPKVEITDNLIQREPFYARAMDFSVDGDGLSMQALGLEIIRELDCRGIPRDLSAPLKR